MSVYDRFDFEKSERAMDALFVQSQQLPSVPVSSLRGIEVPQVLEPADDEPHSSGPQPVNLDKLMKVTKVLNDGTPSKKVNYASFAEENFDRNISTTKRKSPESSTSKELYNEVQRNSLNFGVDLEEMMTFHKRTQVCKSNRASLRQGSPTRPRFLPSPPASPSFAYEFNNSVMDQSDDTPNSETVSSSTSALMDPFQPEVAMPSPEAICLSPTGPIHQNTIEMSKVRNPPFMNKVEYISIEGTPRESPKTPQRTISFGSIFKSLSSSTTPTPKRSPSRKECHSVEETLEADREFQDYSIPMGRSSYYEQKLELGGVIDSPMSNHSSAASGLMLSRGAVSSHSSLKPTSSGSSHNTPPMVRHASTGAGTGTSTGTSHYTVRTSSPSVAPYLRSPLANNLRYQTSANHPSSEQRHTGSPSLGLSSGRGETVADYRDDTLYTML